MHKVVIIEENISTRKLLISQISNLRPHYNIIQQLSTLNESLEWLKSNEHPNILFLSIQLSDGFSFELFNQIKINSFVIFTTPFDEYAIHAFQVNSMDYLLKPIKNEPLEKALDKYDSLCNFKHPGFDTSDIKELSSALVQGKFPYRSRFLVPINNGIQKIDTKDIALFYSSHKLTQAITFDNQYYTIDFSLDKLAQQLNPQSFFRSNRQFILNTECIDEIQYHTNGKLTIKTTPHFEEDIVISREKAKLFKEWINR